MKFQIFHTYKSVYYPYFGHRFYDRAHNHDGEHNLLTPVISQIHIFAKLHNHMYLLIGIDIYVCVRNQLSIGEDCNWEIAYSKEFNDEI